MEEYVLRKEQFGILWRSSVLQVLGYGGWTRQKRGLPGILCHEKQKVRCHMKTNQIFLIFDMTAV